jgi:transcriptional regulator with XRE-family HTH domain
MPEDARRIFANHLNILLERRGINQIDVARELDVTTATVSNSSNGIKYPRIDVMQRLADYLKVNLSALISEDGLKDLDDMERLEALHQNPELGLLFDRSRKMSSEDIQFMLQVADRIMKERDNN